MTRESRKAMKHCLKGTTISRRKLKRKLHEAEEKTIAPNLTQEQNADLQILDVPTAD